MKTYKKHMATRAKQRRLNAFLMSKNFYDARLAIFAFLLGIFFTCMLT